MTETELNEQIAALLAASDQIDCQEGRGRRYRRRQKSLKGNRLLRMCNYGWYWSFRNRCISDCLDFEGHTLLHSGSYIKYNKNSNRQQYLKKQANRCARRYPLLAGKGNLYRRVFDYWWRLD